MLVLINLDIVCFFYYYIIPMNLKFFTPELGNTQQSLDILRVNLSTGSTQEEELVNQYSSNPTELLQLLNDTDDLKLFLSFFNNQNKAIMMQLITTTPDLLAQLLCDIDSFSQVLKYIDKTNHPTIIHFLMENQNVINHLIVDNETLNLANSIAKEHGLGTPFNQYKQHTKF